MYRLVPHLHVSRRVNLQVEDTTYILTKPGKPTRTGEGLQALRQQLLQQAGWQQASEGLFIARERHVQALRRVREHLEVADAHLAAQAQNLDLLAEELRLGQTALNEITGEFSADDLLGVIFSSFCIGK